MPFYALSTSSDELLSFSRVLDGPYIERQLPGQDLAKVLEVIHVDIVKIWSFQDHIRSITSMFFSVPTALRQFTHVALV